MKITRHYENLCDKEEVEIVTTHEVSVDFERSEGEEVCTEWLVYTTYRYDEFHNEDIVFSRAYIKDSPTIQKVELTEQERKEIEEHISKLGGLYSY